MALTLDIFDVGQGDGMLVTFPNGKTMMVDLGSTKNKGLVTTDSFKYFMVHTKYKDPGQDLDYLVLTHGDRDHYNMIIPFVQAFKPKIGTVIHGGPASEYPVGGTTNLVDWLRQNQNNPAINTLTGSPGQNFPMDPVPGGSIAEFGAEVCVLSMGLQVTGSSPADAKNAKSVVLQIRYPPGTGPAIMLTGDATKEVERAILATYQANNQLPRLKSEVLKLGHHGSHRTSNTVSWLKAVNPHWVFVTSDRSGSIDPDEQQANTGYRLPQQLTLDLVKKHCPRLAKGLDQHGYVASVSKNDYVQYNANPDIAGDSLSVPADQEWIQNNDDRGIFSTLATMGLNTDADQGVQYRVTVKDNGDMSVTST